MSKRDYEVNVAVTGGAGNIAYALYPRLLSDVFENANLGYDYRVNLRLLEIPAVVEKLGGVAMELIDLASPHLGDVVCTADPHEAFDGADVAVLLGGVPRGPGMQRSDLLAKNAPVFVQQGKALNAGAADDAKILVVGNPANANTLVALKNAPSLRPEQFAAMSRLDHNRAVSQLAIQSMSTGVTPKDIKRVAIWGNHSPTMVTDISNATVFGRPLLDSTDISLPDWYAEYSDLVAERGTSVIAARGASSAMSAAAAIADQLRDWVCGSDRRWHSMGLYSDGTLADIPEGVVSSVPVITDEKGYCTVAPTSLRYDEIESRKQVSYSELLDERAQLEALDVL